MAEKPPDFGLKCTIEETAVKADSSNTQASDGESNVAPSDKGEETRQAGEKSSDIHDDGQNPQKISDAGEERESERRDKSSVSSNENSSIDMYPSTDSKGAGASITKPPQSAKERDKSSTDVKSISGKESLGDPHLLIKRA